MVQRCTLYVVRTTLHCRDYGARNRITAVVGVISDLGTAATRWQVRAVESSCLVSRTDRVVVI